jgi:hypothetical protein
MLQERNFDATECSTSDDRQHRQWQPGNQHERFIHVPIELLVNHVKRLDPAGGWWHSVLAATGQPERFD